LVEVEVLEVVVGWRSIFDQEVQELLIKVLMVDSGLDVVAKYLLVAVAVLVLLDGMEKCSWCWRYRITIFGGAGLASSNNRFISYKSRWWRRCYEM
jgi:intracellular septation protein A